MIKQKHKVTTLLLAATMVSVIPATSVYATEKLPTKDGAINNGIAYKGSFVISAEPENNDEGVYFFNNDKYLKLEDISTSSEYNTYNNKYLKLSDNKDLFVDLTNGSITNNKLDDEAIDNAAMNLRNVIKAGIDNKDYRYDKEASKKVPTLNSIPNIKFSNDEWYETSYKSNSSVKDNINAPNYSLYTDANGNYIDGDYSLGNLSVEVSSSTTSSATTLFINNTKDTYTSSEDSSVYVTANVKSEKVIGQDSNYIYRLAKIELKPKNCEIKSINGRDISDETNAFTINYNKSIFNLNSQTDASISFNVIQKISKKQSEKTINGAKYSNSVSEYILSDENGKISEDVQNFKNLLNDDDTIVLIKDSALIAYNKANKIIQKASLDNSLKFDYVKVYSQISDENITDIDMDINGDIWTIGKRLVSKFNIKNNSLDEVYNVDGDINKLSVYSPKNILTWSEDSDVYSLISSDTDEKESDVLTFGWIRNSDNSLSYNDFDGEKAIGWKKINDKTYYFSSLGIMQTGWVKDNKKWYYMNGDGCMVTDTTINGYTLGSDGALIS